MENVLIGIGIVGLVLVGVIAVIQFIKSDRSSQMNKVREWLLFAVTEAEKQFGTSTGAIKLRYVYDLFIAKFPAISKVLSFDSFSLLVDEALKQFKKLLIGNKTLQEKVYGKELNEEELKKLQEQIGSDSNE